MLFVLLQETGCFNQRLPFYDGSLKIIEDILVRVHPTVIWVVTHIGQSAITDLVNRHP